jgi:hypothetical protein
VFELSRFSGLAHEVFDATMQELGYEFLENKLQQENSQVLYARKGDIQLIFRLEATYQIYLFSLEMTLIGELSEKATSDARYRTVGVSTIARYSDAQYKISTKNPSTEDEIREEMETQKKELLSYCRDILNEDLTMWTKVADILIARRSKWAR